jgi:hypothetical protein
MRKKDVSIPAVPAPSNLITALSATSTPKRANCLELMSPVANSTKIRRSVSGIRTIKTV